MHFQGLDQDVAVERLGKFGPNIIAEENKINVLKLLLSQLRSPLIFILIFAAVVAVFLSEIIDAAFIMLVVIVNSLLGFFQEYKAESTLKSLRSNITSTVKVIRSGKKQQIKSALIVPGDIILLEPGLRIPADARLLQATELMIDESVLTGESEPVSKHANKDNVYAGTAVFEGIGIAEVILTGQETKFGKIAAELINELDPDTPIKLQLKRVAQIVSVIVVFITILIVVLGYLRNFEFREIFGTAIAISVSAIPEGLIISLTLTLAVGMNRIMAKKAIVKNLPAAETLGGVNVLCLDKTGTLTYGAMKVTDFKFTDKDRGLKALAYCNNDSNFIDKALKEFVEQQTNSLFVEEKIIERTEFFPFASKTKYAGALAKGKLYATGAPETIFNFCKAVDPEWQQLVNDKSKDGFRIIAVAEKEVIESGAQRADFKHMHLLGLLFVIDPIRPSASDSIKRILQAGIEIKVITGDLKATAARILHELDFPLTESEVLSGQELEAIKDSSDIDNVISRTKLFYRTTPDQKLLIVQSLQKQGRVVGMMGDGVNDSPALKKAEIGITVDNATDVSREVSDIVLLDSNFETIVMAIAEGRSIFSNLRKIMTFLFSGSLSETILIVFSIIAGLPLPLLPLQLLWINLITDGLPGSALSFDETTKDLLKDHPRKKSESIFDRTVISSILIISVILNIIYFMLFGFLINGGYNTDSARTMVFAGVSFSSLLFLFSAKTADSNIWKENIFSNKFLNIAVIGGVGVTLLAIYLPLLNGILNTVPLSTPELIIVIILSIFHIVATEIIKFIIHKLRS